jgi:SAM-dependent methyltransferase
VDGDQNHRQSKGYWVSCNGKLWGECLDREKAIRRTEQGKLAACPTSDAQIPVLEDPWEAAYLKYETQNEEIRKFYARLLKLGARGWRRDSRIVELFCGRGNGLYALQELGFTHVEGADLSPRLVAE